MRALRICTRHGCGDAENLGAWKETQTLQSLPPNKQLSCRAPWGGDSHNIIWNAGEVDVGRLYICTKAGKSINIVNERDLIVSTGDPLSKVFPGRPVTSSVLDKEYTTVLKSWVDGCQDKHQLCPNRSDHLLLTGAFDVGSLTKESRLVISEGQTGQWASLSHCWGGSVALKTEIRTIEKYCQGIVQFVLELFPSKFRVMILSSGAGLKVPLD